MNLLYILFSILFLSSDSFFILNKIKNNKIFYNSYLKFINNRHKTIKNPKYIINYNKNNYKFEYNNITEFYYENILLKNKKIINIYPAGIQGFYEMGICTYIKNKFKIDNFIFSGASAGAWNSLLMSYKGNITVFNKLIFNINLNDTKSIYQLQLKLKNEILNNFESHDFDFNKIYIGVSVFENFKFNNYIFTDFESLEDALDCIIASSNIPFITGKLFLKYKNRFCFDGGFNKDPFIHNPNKIIEIHPGIFKNSDYKEQEVINLLDPNLFKPNFNIINKLFNNGYDDALKNNNYIKKYIINSKI